jgi:PAS domain S-box-containing protein
MDASHAFDKADLVRMSEQRFQAVWEVASDAMALSTADGIVIAANPAYFRLYGYAPEMVLGQPFSVIFREEERRWADELYQIRYRSPVPVAAVETTVRRGDGSEGIVEASYTFLEEQGRRIAMLSIIRDITERKQREEQLREYGLKVQMAQELAHLESWEWDWTTNQVRWSANLDPQLSAFLQARGATGDAFLDLVHPEDRAQIQRAIRQDAEGEPEQAVVFRFCCPDGSQWWARLRTYAFADETGRLVRTIGMSAPLESR